MIHLSRPIVCIVGPTATGKTNLAQAYAEHVGGEIVSADSMQINRGMDIGTSKIAKDERTVNYYGLDIVNPGEPYSAALFQEYARASFRDIDSKGKPVILVGGTGFYIRAAIDDYRFPKGEQKNNPVRKKYEDFLAANGSDALWCVLNECDSESASIIHPNNTKRVIRALEMYDAGESYANLANNLKNIPQLYDAIFIGLKLPREILYKRINNRVDLMIKTGLIDEVKALLDAGFKDGLTASQAIGYKELVRALNDEITIDTAIDDIKRATRRYAKRQETWFNKDKRIHWLDTSSVNSDTLLDQVVNIVEQHKLYETHKMRGTCK